MNGQEKKTILLVEDEVFIAMRQKMDLEKSNYSVFVAHTGEKAIEIVKSNPGINLILTDIDLGKGIDGTETARQIIAIKDLPVVFLTSHDEKEYVDKVKQITRYGYVIKNSGNFVLQSSIEMAFELFEAHNKTKKSEQSKIELINKLNQAQQIAHIGSWDWDLKTNQIWWSDETYRIFGVSAQGGYTPGFTENAKYIHPDDIKRYGELFEHSFNTGDSLDYDCRLITSDGELKYCSAKGELQYDSEGNQVAFIGTVHDLTERKLAEEEIKRQLSEKNILLKEIHHRIKNNIESIKNILSIQMESTTNPEVVSSLQNALGRINSMRILYSKLLITEDYNDISVKSYMESLIDAVFALFPDNLKITCNKQIDDFILSSKTMFPLGIILNELLTNVMKFAFKGREFGLINISFTVTNNQVRLTVQDNGNGLPESFDIRKQNGFGITLVGMLSKQLGGMFTIENTNGTKCNLTFDI